MIDLEPIKEACNIYNEQVYAELSATVLRELISELETLRAERDEYERALKLAGGVNMKLTQEVLDLQLARNELMEQEPVEWQQMIDHSWSHISKSRYGELLNTDQVIRKLYAQPIPVYQANQSERPLEMVEQPYAVLETIENLRSASNPNARDPLEILGELRGSEDFADITSRPWSKEAEFFGSGVQPSPVVAMPDHIVAQTINSLRDIAIEFHGAQQLRERIAGVIRPLLSTPTPPSVKER